MFFVTISILSDQLGMSDSGSHGGSSKAEVEIPLTFLMEGCQPDSESISDFSNHLQIDLAPTIAVLMGIPIPSNNLGSIIPGVLGGFEMTHKLYAVYTNARNMYLQLERNAENPVYERAVKLYQDWLTNNATKNGNDIMNLFLQAVEEMSSSSVKNLAQFDLYIMIISIVLSFQVSTKIIVLFHEPYSKFVLCACVLATAYFSYRRSKTCDLEHCGLRLLYSGLRPSL